MKFIKTIAAVRSVEQTTWTVADGLVEDFQAEGIAPTPLEFKEAAEALEKVGFSYDPGTLQDYWRVASVFGKNTRRARVSVKVYAEIVSPLWSRVDPATRINDLRAYAKLYFDSSESVSSRSARAWARAQGIALDTERKARLEAESKAKAEADLVDAEARLQEATASGKREHAEKALVQVNNLRRRLGMDLLKLEKHEDPSEDEVATDEEATEESRDEGKREQARVWAKSKVEKALANVSMKISSLKYDYAQFAKFLAQDDLDAYADEIDGLEGELALIRAEFSGVVSDVALAAALADWSSETTE